MHYKCKTWCKGNRNGAFNSYFELDIQNAWMREKMEVHDLMSSHRAELFRRTGKCRNLWTSGFSISSFDVMVVCRAKSDSKKHSKSDLSGQRVSKNLTGIAFQTTTIDLKSHMERILTRRNDSLAIGIAVS